MSIIYPVLNGLLNKHLKTNDDDLLHITKLKDIVKAQLLDHFSIQSAEIIHSISIFASALDPHHHHLTGLNETQRQLTLI